MPSNLRAFMIPALPRHTDMLGNKHFVMALWMAMVLHIVGYYIWYISPKTAIIDIPVRALNIKLTDENGVNEEEIKLAAPQEGNYSEVENTIMRLVRSQEQEAVRANTVEKSMDKVFDKADPGKPLPPPPKGTGTLHKFDMRSEGVKAAAPVMQVVEARQFVRDLAPLDKPFKTEVAPTPAAKDKTTSSAGNTTQKEADVLARYEQLISLWIEKFKQYPEAAKTAGKQGETVVRIRIDRRGNIRYYTLERSTGHPELDHAAVEMIRRANPVPAVPANYPASGDVLEFLIPVNFQLQ